jgi:arginyl-tRNA--protein-N-Asp/Glu arginylyltransferase
MFGEKRYPESLSPEELDVYLANGWYRMGQSIFTTHFLCFEDQFYSAVWVRMPLKDYTFSKSLRKLIRRNYNSFEVRFQPAEITAEKEALYQSYKKDFPGQLAPTLEDSLHEGFEGNIFNTYETLVYDGDKLVAFSFFDLGEKSAASILGVYDYDYNKYSLGLFTVLLEIIFCINNNFELFYPGYVVPGNSRFDYKLRIGDVDYFDLGTRKWLNYQTLKEEQVPLIKMEQKLKKIQALFKEQNFNANYYYYPLFEANLFGYWNAPYFDFPNLLLLKYDNGKKNYLAIVFDPREDAYQLLGCSEFDNVFFYFNSEFVNTFSQDKFFTELITTDRMIAESKDEQKILEIAKDLIMARVGKD